MHQGSRDRIRGAVILFVIAVVINYVWEMAQMPLYESMPFAEISSWLICLRASLGDGLIVMVIWGGGALLFRSALWFRHRQPLPALYLLSAGAAIAIGIELHALANGRWSYSPLMPVLPLLEVGVSPFLQLLLLPWISMWLARRRLRRSARVS
jgi:hypothetical protein